MLNRIAWFFTLLTLALVALLSPQLIEFTLKNYRNDELKAWWTK